MSNFNIKEVKDARKSMNASREFYQVVRHLFFYRNQATSILKSRTYTVGKTLKSVVKQPASFGKKAVIMVANDPKRLYDIVTGKRAIQNNKLIQAQLLSEYSAWLEATKLTDEDLTDQQKSKEFKRQPLISLITPVFNPPLNAHKKLIDSVLAQTYQNFELLLYNFGEDKATQEMLDMYAQKDKRVRVKHDLPNQGIGANSDVCLKDVTGEFVGLLDHDDALTPDALYECVKALNETDTDFIYTDKDKISEDDVRSEPLFKPDWSPEMALGGNYMTHFNLMNAKLVKELGGWDPVTDGAQDWDLFLRLIEKTSKPIVHVPKIVYHWRTVKTSTSTGNSAKPYVIKAQQRAVQKHLMALGLSEVEPKHDINSQMNIHWLAKKQPTVLIHAMLREYGTIEKLVTTMRLENRDLNFFVLTDEENPDSKDFEKLRSLPINIVTYNPGEFIETVLGIKNQLNSACLFMTDSVKDVHNVSGHIDWASQLCGWLDMPGVVIAGGGLYADTGQISDIGSFYDKGSNQFSKYYFGAGLRSGYNGHSQWIRNHVLVNEKLFVFNTDLLNTFEELDDCRDDEFAKALASVAYSQKLRCVYDPLIYGTDNAPFELRLIHSSSLSKFINQHCESLAKQGDPYFNTNLDARYTDPKPHTSLSPKADITYIRTVEDIY